LKSAPAGEASIEILSAAGDTIRTFSIPARAGMNRFEWDLRFTDARGLPERTFLMGGSLRGPLAAPGTYQMKLVVGSETATRALEIRKDPRIPTTADDFQEQLDLLLRIRDRLSEAHDAVARVTSLKAQVESLLATARDRAELAELAGRATSLAEKLQNTLDRLYEPRFIGVDDQLLLFPLKLNARLASLGGVVSSADRAPTKAAHEVFRKLSSELDAELTKIEAILSSEVPELNQLARGKGMSIISGVLPSATADRGSDE
jgi:hypothetical protein